MDAIRKQTQEECENVFGILPISELSLHPSGEIESRSDMREAIQALLPAVLSHKDKILSVERKTHKYGTTDRHQVRGSFCPLSLARNDHGPDWQLDVYYPPSGLAGPRPILFWAYGGGFVSGERILEPSQGLVYATVGAFFARKGYVVVIPDYRLAPAVQFPAQAEDIRDAMVWVIKNARGLGTPGVTLDADTLVAMGHSAGAINMATVYLLPDLLAGTDIPKRTRAIVLESGLYAFDMEGVAPAIPPPIVGQYYGPPDLQGPRKPLGLLRALSDEQFRALPPMLFVEAEKEPAAVVQSGTLFRQLLERRRGGKPAQRVVAQGHNHISLNWTLGTGDGEEWGEQVALWLGGALA
jgi:acetyl esterase/lipase